jgi:transcriptional regulator with XRE-family HTH domain
MMYVMASASTPTLRGRRLAQELRTLREEAGLTQADVARRVGWSKSKISRIEEPATRPDDDDVRALLQLYGADASRHPAILQLNQDSWQRGWWTLYDDAFTGNFVMLEGQSPDIRIYETMLVPGLFQTPEYARFVYSNRRGVTDADLDRLVEARMTRKKILHQASPPQVHAVIHEAALCHRIGDPDLMGGQINEMWSLAVTRSNVTLQVLPFTAAVPPSALLGSFTLFTFPDDHGLDVAHAEGLLGEGYVENAADLARTRVAFEHVSRAALPPEESAEWLAARKRE